MFVYFAVPQNYKPYNPWKPDRFRPDSKGETNVVILSLIHCYITFAIKTFAEVVSLELDRSLYATSNRVELLICAS